jgi:hypothetical protein
LQRWLEIEVDAVRRRAAPRVVADGG